MALVRYLFVYGTLLSAARGPMGRLERARLGREGEVVSAAAMRGRLYDLGGFPGLIPAGDPDNDPGAGLVWGELVRLRAPATSFLWLDRYEGVVAPGEGVDAPYLRTPVAVEVAPAGGEGGPTAGGTAPAARRLQAWVYLYRHSVAGRRAIGSGNWLER
ncbi:MAG: gamma-glutamylcyclotransferase [Hyphomicrobiaceae bacterium]